MNDVLFVVLLIIDIIERYMLARHIDALNRELDGKPENPMPSVKTFGRQFALAVKRVKIRRLKNGNKTKVVPDVSQVFMNKFIDVLLSEIESSVSIESVVLSEAEWIVNGKFRETVGGGAKVFRACMDRLEAANIVTRADGNNRRTWKQPYRSVVSKLRKAKQ